MGDNGYVPSDGFSPQQMALLAQGQGVGVPHSPYEGDCCYVV